MNPREVLEHRPGHPDTTTLTDALKGLSPDQANNLVGNVAPRVTEGDIAANIVGEYYFTAHEGVAGAQAIAKAAKLAIGLPEAEAGAVLAPVIVKAHPCLRLLTLCVLITRTGFMVCGTSAPASPANFNAELGKKYARENAVKQLWPLMGYALRERLHESTPRVDVWPEVAAPVVVDAVHHPHEPEPMPDPVPDPPGGP